MFVPLAWSTPVSTHFDIDEGAPRSGAETRPTDGSLELRAERPYKADRNATMAKRCEVCGKGPVVGRNISHAHTVSPRRFEPNLQRVRAIVNGGVRRLRVCTRCLRSNKVVKAA